MASFARRRRRPSHGSRLPPARSPLYHQRYGIAAEDDEPFFVTVFKVGSTLLLLGAITVISYLIRSALFGHPKPGADLDDVEGESPEEVLQFVRGEGVETEDSLEEEGSNAFPTFDLGDEVGADAYGIANAYLTPYDHKEADAAAPPLSQFLAVAARMRDDFARSYGGENAARLILARGITTFTPGGTDSDDVDNYAGVPSGLRRTADRIRQAREEARPFKMAFGGSSVTAGRGNRFRQSFPFVVEEMLSEPMELLGVQLEVRNAAVGKISSFPYGWCLGNYLGRDSDVVSWDFAASESGGGAEGLEAYLRRVMTMERKPMLIVRSSHVAEQRRDLLKEYVDLGAIADPIIIHMEPATEPFLDMNAAFLPPGFQDWRQFGAPPGAPGMAEQHLAVQEHKLLGRMIAMHMLGAMELVAANLMGSELAGLPGSLFKGEGGSIGHHQHLLPKPITFSKREESPNGLARASSLMFGTPFSGAGRPGNPNFNWTMNTVHCRTSFDPILGGGLQEVVVSGTTAEDIDVMLPKGPMFYNKGWVLDLSEEEKRTVRLFKRYNLGYIDLKKAYYGVPASGALRLFLPYDMDASQKQSPLEDDGNESDANRWFRSVLICGVGGERGEGKCDMEKHMTYRVGGLEAKERQIINVEGASYFGEKLCLNVGLPEGAQITSRGEIEETGNEDQLAKFKMREDVAPDISGIGLSLEVYVSSNLVTWKKGPCSVSHVIWEQVNR